MYTASLMQPHALRDRLSHQCQHNKNRQENSAPNFFVHRQHKRLEERLMNLLQTIMMGLKGNTIDLLAHCLGIGRKDKFVSCRKGIEPASCPVEPPELVPDSFITNYCCWVYNMSQYSNENEEKTSSRASQEGSNIYGTKSDDKRSMIEFPKFFNQYSLWTS